MATKNLSTKAKYVPNRMINEIEVERNGKTTTIDGADLLDGAYVKKSVKFGNGGGVAVSSESGLAVGTNADLLMNQQNLQYRKGGGLKGKSNYISNRMINEMEVERNGKTTIIDGADLLDGAYVKKGVKYAKGSTVKGNKYNGRYDSIHDFVSENKLEKEADNIFGKGWEADNDVEMIEVLLEKIGNSEYVVKETGNYINVKASYGNGGGVAVSSESGLAFGTNAELLMNEQNLRYGQGGGVGEKEYLVKAIITDENETEIPISVNVFAKSENSAMDKAENNIREQNPKMEDFSIDIESVEIIYGQGGNMGTWCYEIGGL
jgi:hypothetical protein